MKVILSLKMVRIYVDFKNAITLQKNFFLLKIIAFQLVARPSVNYDKDTSDPTSTS